MELMTMEEVTADAIECITAHDMPVVEAIDATVAMYDLNIKEHHQLIYWLARKGYRA